MSQSLAIKYRPKTFDDVVEQSSTIVILRQQILTCSFRSAYLFVGAAGTGKTTCARIFANEINKGEGNPIEMDAASHNSVEDVREIGKLAITMSMVSEYKVFIIDECHSLSNTAWQAMLKLIEEPPAKSIFIFCTTDPQKIPKTILSRCQRYNFQRISKHGIMQRLTHILHKEDIPEVEDGLEAVDFIARQAEGGLRDAIQLLDKCLAYSTELTLDNVVEALALSDYNTLIELTTALIKDDKNYMLSIIEEVYSSGMDMKQFIRQYLNFILDIKKIIITGEYKYTALPNTDDIKDFVIESIKYEYMIDDILDMLVELNADIKYDQSPRYLIEAKFMLFDGGIER